MSQKLIMTMSGTRGVIGENLSPQVAMNIAMAFGATIGKGPVIVGGDTRVSYDMLKNAVISSLIAVGVDVIDIGQVPTPTVQQLIRHYGASGGVVITASHNPIMWNGIKLMNASGSFFTSDEHASFMKQYENLDDIKLAKWDTLGKVSIESKALEIHVDKILNSLDIDAVKKSDLKVLVDTNNGTGALANPVLFDRLGIDYELMNSEPNGRFAHDPEPLKKNLSQIMEKMKSEKYDIGFVQDADADRLVILDETGKFIGEDYSLALGVDYILSQPTDLERKVVVNVSTSRLIEDLAKKHNAEVIYTKVGEPNVTAKLKELNAQVGGEGNGGIIYPKIGWGRDSLVGIVIALKYLAESGKKVSEIVADYIPYVMLREKIEVRSRQEIENLLKTAEKNFPGVETNKIDGLKFIWNDAWLHIRPSNTEPIVRIFVEAKSMEKAEDLYSQAIKTKISV